MTKKQLKKVCVETWGCQMNTADSEKMVALLKRKDYVHCTAAEDADVVILNTCHIREKAYHKVKSRLGILKEFKRKDPNKTIVVAGCVAQAEGKKMLQASPEIDVLLGPAKIFELPNLLEQHVIKGEQVSALGFTRKDTEKNTLIDEFSAEQTVDEKNLISRFVTIQRGCDNYCTFCVVPFTRGPEESVTPDLIINQIKEYVKTGAKEITLLGQNVNSYGQDLDSKHFKTENPFVELLEAVCHVEGLESVRFTTSNPHDLTKELAELYGKYPILGQYYHLPVQSGSDSMLSRMKRKVTRAEYLEKVKWLKEACPTIALSTDIIVGFPGETDQDFQDTVSLVREVGFGFSFIFKYSKRKHTPANRYKDQVEEEIKNKRLQELMKIQDELTVQSQLSQIGQKTSALILYQSKKSAGMYYGRTPHFRLVKIESGRDIVGQRVDLEIIDGNKTALLGRLI